MLKSLIIFLLGLASIYTIVLAGTFIFQKHLIHVPFAGYVATPTDRGMRFESVTLRQQNDTARLNGWFVEHSDAQFTVLVFGGNAGNMSYMLDTVHMFHEMGYSVFIFDYRGYGASEGELTESAMYDDARLAWNHLTDTRQILPDNIIVFGRSLGAAMASWVASEYKPAALIMESGFTSLERLGAIYYKWLPISYLLRFRYDNLSRIANVNCPVLFIHSSEDELVPYSESVDLYRATTAERSLLTISGNHARGYLDSGEAYTNGIEAFLKHSADTDFSPSAATHVIHR